MPAYRDRFCRSRM